MAGVLEQLNRAQCSHVGVDMHSQGLTAPLTKQKKGIRQVFEDTLHDAPEDGLPSQSLTNYMRVRRCDQLMHVGLLIITNPRPLQMVLRAKTTADTSGAASDAKTRKLMQGMDEALDGKIYSYVDHLRHTGGQSSDTSMVGSLQEAINVLAMYFLRP